MARRIKVVNRKSAKTGSLGTKGYGLVATSGKFGSVMGSTAWALKSTPTPRGLSARPELLVQLAPTPTPSLLDPYDWGEGGVPQGKPLNYIPGKGFDFGDL